MTVTIPENCYDVKQDRTSLPESRGFVLTFVETSICRYQQMDLPAGKPRDTGKLGNWDIIALQNYRSIYFPVFQIHAVKEEQARGSLLHP
jgi:hypothetical protein